MEKESTIGVKIKDTRLAKKMSQKDLSNKLGTHVNTISNWENNRSIPKHNEIIEKIKEILGIDIREIQDTINKEKEIQTIKEDKEEYDLLDFLNMSVIPDQLQEPAPETTEISKAKKNDDSTEAIQRQYGQITPRFIENKTKTNFKSLIDTINKVNKNVVKNDSVDINVKIKKGTKESEEDIFNNDNIFIKENIDETRGIILGCVNSDTISLPKESRINSNIAIIGKKGTIKYSSFLRNLIFQCADWGESIVVSDISGELYNETSSFLKRMGYEVKQFNVKNPFCSDSWNCLQECATQGEDNIQLLVQQFAGIIMDNTTPSGGSGGGDSVFFNAVEGSLLTSLCLFKLLDPFGLLIDDPHISLGDVYDILTDRAVLEKDFETLRAQNPEHPALKSYSIYISVSDNVRGNIVAGLANRLQILQSDVIYEIIGHTDIDLELPAKRPTAYFLISPEQDSTLKLIMSLFFTSLFTRIFKFANRCPEKKLIVPVNFIFNDLCNFGKIQDFEKKILLANTHNIKFSLFFQSLTQLEKLYTSNEIQEILNNCDVQIYLDGNDLKTLEYFLKKCDKQAIINSANGKPVFITATKLQNIKEEKLIAFVSGQQPILLNSYNHLNHPDAKYLKHCSFEDHEPAWFEGFVRKKENRRKNALRLAGSNFGSEQGDDFIWWK